LQEADSIYTLAVTGEEQRFDLGSSNVLQRATARTQAMLMRARVQQVKSESGTGPHTPRPVDEHRAGHR
jgi:hypothetical protein